MGRSMSAIRVRCRFCDAVNEIIGAFEALPGETVHCSSCSGLLGDWETLVESGEPPALNAGKLGGTAPPDFDSGQAGEKE